MVATGVACGLNKGYITTKRARPDSQVRKKGKEGQRVAMVRGIVREVAGYAPYERRMMEILKGGGSNPQKRCWKFAKNRLGTHLRAKRKVQEITDVVALIAKQAAAEKATAAAKAAEKEKAKNL